MMMLDLELAMEVLVVYREARAGWAVLCTYIKVAMIIRNE
jgi:hypothetical protein